MKPYSLVRAVAGAVAAGVLLFGSAVAQTGHEEQAKTILQLFESGQKDSAYALLEPLKKSARLEPAVLYVRAQMTPDDRALGLYKEVIAIEPTGAWADRAAFQLVSRYAEKRDSVAAYTWANALKTNYPRSPLVAESEEILKNPGSWRSTGDDLADLAATKGKTPASPAKPTATTKKAEEKKTDPKAETTPVKKVDAKTPEKTDAKKTAVADKPAEKKAATTTKPAAAATEKYTSSGMKGYALQVGLYPTRDKADDRAAELKKKNIRSVSLPKMIDGKKQYALVVGPYTSIEDATKKKPVIAGACDCKAFIVRVD